MQCWRFVAVAIVFLVSVAVYTQNNVSGASEAITLADVQGMQDQVKALQTQVTRLRADNEALRQRHASTEATLKEHLLATPKPDTQKPVTPVPETPIPETPIPETPIPETPIPETPIPETAIPETPIPETLKPETSIPDSPQPETAPPETPAPTVETPCPTGAEELELMAEPLAPIPPHYPKRYVIFEPWVGGPNNRRVSLETVTALSMRLNATMILPPISFSKNNDMYHDAGEREITFHHYYNMTVMKRVVPVLTWVEAVRHNIFAGVMDRPRLRNITCQFPRAGCLRLKPIAERVFSFNGPRVEGYGADQDFYLDKNQFPVVPEGETIIHGPYTCCFIGFYSMVRFFEPLADRARYYRTIRDAFEFTDEIKALSAQWVERMGGVDKFSCIHARLGDFKMFDMKAFVEPDFLVDKFYDLFPKNGTIFIASDDDRHARRALVNYTDFQFFTMTDLLNAGPPTKVHKTLFAMVSQLTCSKAGVFIANYKSTYSAFITRMRGYRGAPPPAAHYIHDDPTKMSMLYDHHSNSQMEHPDSWTQVQDPPLEIAVHAESKEPYPDDKVVRRHPRNSRKPAVRRRRTREKKVDL